jgi:V8-like Glu-specific endopeptidase
MKIDWNRKADGKSVGETASILLGSGRGGGLEGLESTGPSENERLERLRDAMAAARPVAPDGQRAGIEQQVLAGAASGLAKLNQGEPAENFTFGEHAGLESVILTNGERPSLLVRNGFVDLNAPDIGDWGDQLSRVSDQIRKVVTSVGRIDVPVNPGFAGTCFVIAEGLVLTNRHVLEAIATQDAITRAWTLRWPDATSVNFLGEDAAAPAPATQFKVTGVAFAGPDPINGTVNFAHLDMAVLRVDPASDSNNAFPKPVTLETDTTRPVAEGKLYVVGFPGQPKIWVFGGTPATGHETTQVISDLFNNKFGVKRLAPGTIKVGAGKIANDPKGWICAHDASTLGGNSGSCIVDLSGDGLRIVALHFAGLNREQNWAHVAARLREQLANSVL